MSGTFAGRVARPFRIFSRLSGVVVELSLLVGSGGGRVTAAGRLRLGIRVAANGARSGHAVSSRDQLRLVRALLGLRTPGVVAEFGCYRGMTSASLSLACRLVGRKLVIFDSFQGLPDPGTHTRVGGTSYEEGMYRAALEEVKANITQYGDVAVCEFVPGFFAESLSRRNEEESFAFVFEDVDLESSVREVLEYVLPHMPNGGVIWCHEALDPRIRNAYASYGLALENVGRELARVRSPER